MSKYITFMRHGQSGANAAHIWQGVGSSPLTAGGRAQAAAAGDRLARRTYSLVVASDLERASNTARIAGFDPEEREIWREGDLGGWEGLTFAEVMDRFGDELKRLNTGEELPMGGSGETGRQVADRALKGVEEILAELDDGQSALVVTHGGLINGLLRRMLDISPGGRRVGIPANTSFTEMSFTDSRPRVDSFNDAHHLGPVSTWTKQFLDSGHSVIEMIRHGQTDGNLDGVLQGHANWPLNATGRTQATALARHIGDVDAVYASPLGRAHETSEIVFPGRAHAADALKEIDAGEWNGQKVADLPQDELYRQIFVDFEDARRGRNGETWEELRSRVAAFLDDTAKNHEGGRVATVTHGGSIKAFIGGVFDLDYRSNRTLLGHVANTSVTQVVMLASGPMVTSFNVAGHLED